MSVACDLAPGRTAVGLQELILRNCPEHINNRKTQAEFRISADTDTTTGVVCNDYESPTHYSFTPVLNSSARDRPSLPKRVIDLPVYCDSVTFCLMKSKCSHSTVKLAVMSMRRLVRF